MLTIMSNLGVVPQLRRLRRTKWTRQVARAWLRNAVLADEPARRDDVTVLIGVRNRADHRLINALRSIRAQSHPPDLVRPLVIDYGSEPKSADRTAEMCAQHGAGYLRVAEPGPWSRARCLNIGLRRADTKFLMTADVDIVLSPGYLADAIDALARSPLSVICSPMLDLPEESTESFVSAAQTGVELPLDHWKQRSARRMDMEFHPSVGVSFTVFLQLIRGYDEFFEVWGGEDRDLMKRLTQLGLEYQPLESGSFYLHQWHPKFQGVSEDATSQRIIANREHAKTTHTIVRNDDRWGRPTSAYREPPR